LRAENLRVCHRDWTRCGRAEPRAAKAAGAPRRAPQKITPRARFRSSAKQGGPASCFPPRSRHAAGQRFWKHASKSVAQQPAQLQHTLPPGRCPGWSPGPVVDRGPILPARLCSWAVYSRTLAVLFVGLQTSHGTHKGGESRGATRAPHEGEREASVVVPCTRRARAALLPALACHCRLRALRVLRRWSRGGRAGEARACACGSGWATRAMRVRSAVFSTCTSVESGSMCTHTHTLAPPLSFSARTHARTRASTHTHTCMRLTRPRTRTRAHARTHALTHLRTRAHTHARSAAVVLLHQAGPRGAGGAARCARGRGTGPGSGRQRGGREARGAEARLTQARG